MDISDLKYLTVCQECGCVFDYVIAIDDFRKDSQISVCPACKHEYEIPEKVEKYRIINNISLWRK